MIADMKRVAAFSERSPPYEAISCEGLKLKLCRRYLLVYMCRPGEVVGKGDSEDFRVLDCKYLHTA